MSGAQVMARSLRVWPRFAWAVRNPERSQRALWEHTAKLLAQGSFWPERVGSDLSDLSRYEPTTYEDYRACIDRSFQGRRSHLNGEEVLHWVISSGSSGARKIFPWTASFVRQFRAGAQMPFPTVARMVRVRGVAGSHLALISHNVNEWSPVGIPVGYVSNLAGKPLINTRSEEVYPRCVDDSTDTSRKWLPMYAAAADLASISAVTAEHVLLLMGRVQKDFADYVGYLRGTERPPEPFRPPAPSPERLAHLERVFAANPAPSPTDIWPRLRLVQTWRAASAGLQARELQRRLGPRVRIVDLAYCATEGPITLPIDLDAVGGPIHPGSIIHEFLEAGAAPTRGNVLKAWELRPGATYEILLTTHMGLVRYRIGDIVRCEGFHRRAPILVFDRRTTGELSLGVTTFSEEYLLKAMDDLRHPVAGKWVFGPSEAGDALVLYVDGAEQEGLQQEMHDLFLRTHGTYADRLRKGRVCPVRQQRLASEHPMWRRCQPPHGQAKPVVLLQEPPSHFETGSSR